jgi:hypothetical protein
MDQDHTVVLANGPDERDQFIDPRRRSVKDRQAEIGSTNAVAAWFGEFGCEIDQNLHVDRELTRQLSEVRP